MINQGGPNLFELRDGVFEELCHFPVEKKPIHLLFHLAIVRDGVFEELHHFPIEKKPINLLFHLAIVRVDDHHVVP